MDKVHAFHDPNYYYVGLRPHHTRPNFQDRGTSSWKYDNVMKYYVFFVCCCCFLFVCLFWFCFCFLFVCLLLFFFKYEYSL